MITITTLLSAVLPAAFLGATLLVPLPATVQFGPLPFGPMESADPLTVGLLSQGRDCQEPDSPREGVIPTGAILYGNGATEFHSLDDAFRLAGQGWETVKVCYA